MFLEPVDEVEHEWLDLLGMQVGILENLVTEEMEIGARPEPEIKERTLFVS